MGAYDYRLWGNVVVNVVFFASFIVAFFRPQKKVEWKSMGVVSAFIVALFTEMYGFPLTIYILTSYLNINLGSLDPFSHINGHLLGTLLGLSESGKLLICEVGNSLMMAGLLIMGIGWWKIHRATGLVTDGIYRYIRHPQYVGLFMITVGMLVQWPTLLTLLMWPILMWRYHRLAKQEEQDCIDTFGDEYRQYRDNTHAYLPWVTPSGSGGTAGM